MGAYWAAETSLELKGHKEVVEQLRSSFSFWVGIEHHPVLQINPDKCCVAVQANSAISICLSGCNTKLVMLGSNVLAD